MVRVMLRVMVSVKVIGLGLDLRSWLLTSRRSDAINFLLAYCQIADQ